MTFLQTVHSKCYGFTDKTLYACDPKKNTTCSKKSCHINGGPCYMVFRQECRLTGLHGTLISTWLAADMLWYRVRCLCSKLITKVIYKLFDPDTANRIQMERVTKHARTKKSK